MRLADERAAARRQAEAAEERRAADAARATAEAARLRRLREAAAEEDEAARRAAVRTSAPPPREAKASRTTLFVSAVAGVAMIGALSAALAVRLPSQRINPPTDDKPPVQSVSPASLAALRLVGRWRTADDVGCDAPLEIAVEGEWLVLRQTVRTNTGGAEMKARAETRERILRLSSDAIVTRGEAGGAERRYEHSGDGLLIGSADGAARYPLAACN